MVRVFASWVYIMRRGDRLTSSQFKFCQIRLDWRDSAELSNPPTQSEGDKKMCGGVKTFDEKSRLGDVSRIETPHPNGVSLIWRKSRNIALNTQDD